MQYFKDMKVYVKVAMNECWNQTAKPPIMVRWVDTDKNCDPRNPNYRSRLVAMQFKEAGDRPDLYSPTPPLEALKALLTLAAAGRKSLTEWDEWTSGGPVEVLHSDISRAYFNAPTTEPTYVRIPEEDWEPGDENRCARLLVSMYGTRKAASNWEAHYSDWLLEIGFERGTGYPSIFVHKERNIKLLVHGDDFITAGRHEQLVWFEREMNQKYESKHIRLGTTKGAVKQIKVLNRIITWEEESISVEADTRHIMTALKDLGLEVAKEVVTPALREHGEKSNDQEGIEAGERIVKGKRMKIQGDGRPLTYMASKRVKEDNEEEELQADEATLFRSVVARFNYLSPDRQDIMYAVRECAKGMAKPKVRDMIKLKRIGRYVLGRKRKKMHLWCQSMPDTIVVHTDSDWAGCKRTRISVSGGVVRLGESVIKCWSKDQHNIAKSSAEAELYAANLGGEHAIGVQTLMREFGHEMKIVVHIDSSAALGVLLRKGIGKIRHLDVADL